MVISGCISAGIENFGEYLQDHYDVPSTDFCQYLCEITNECQFWNFNKFLFRCILLKSQIRKIVVNDTISGSKTCIGNYTIFFEVPLIL